MSSWFVFVFLTALLASGAGFAAGPAETEPSNAPQQELKDEDVTQAVETELLLDEGVPAQRINAVTLNGVVTLSGSVSNLLAKDRAAELARSIKGVRAVVNQIEVEPAFRSDEILKREVEKALASNPATESFDLKVEVNDGVVTLTGSVESWAEQQLAVQTAKGVREVRSVNHDIKLDFASERTDSQLAKDIRARLESNVWVNDALINVKVVEGKAVLTGAVGSAAEKERARLDAWVAGIGKVDTSGLEVKWWARDEMRRDKRYAGVTDAEIEEGTLEAFRHDARIGEHNIQVESEAGTVTLRGSVTDLQAKRAAEQDARNTIGVWRVKNLVRVRPPETLSDNKIEESIRAAFDRDPYLNLADLEVAVLNGRAILTGSVFSSFTRRRAEEVAAAVTGVAAVENNVTHVQPERQASDWEVKQDIEDKLYWSPFVDEEDVTVTVEDGVVTLTGEADTSDERRIAEEKAREGGAASVRNRLKVKYGPGAG